MYLPTLGRSQALYVARIPKPQVLKAQQYSTVVGREGATEQSTAALQGCCACTHSREALECPHRGWQVTHAIANYIQHLQQQQQQQKEEEASASIVNLSPHLRAHSWHAVMNTPFHDFIPYFSNHFHIMASCTSLLKLPIVHQAVRILLQTNPPSSISSCSTGKGR
jgi:hypothetical protein